METTLTPETKKLRISGWLITEVILVLLALLGLAAWIYQTINGLAVTNLTNLVVWGLYITVFMFFVGLSAGGLIVASSGEIFGAKHLKPLAPLAIWLSFICVGLAAASIIPDLGSPQRIWQMIIHPQWNSPFVWDLTIILVYLILSGVYLWLHIKAEGGDTGASKYERLVYGFAFIALPAAILLHSITAWIFGLQIARDYWHTALLAPFFVSSALVSGVSLVILAALLARKLNIIHFEDRLVSWLGGLLATFIAVDSFFLLSEMVTRLYPQAPGEAAPALALISGRYAPLFWSEVIAGLLIPLVLLFTKSGRKRIGIVGTAAGLAIFGIFLKRFTLLMAGFVYPLANFPAGIQYGQALPVLGGNDLVFVNSPGSYMMSYPYSPALVEIAIIVGLVAAGCLVFTLGLQHLPLRVKNKD